MRIPARAVVAVAAAFALFGGMKTVQAATDPEIFSTDVVSPPRQPSDPVAPRTVVTVIGKSLTRFTSFTLFDGDGMPVMATVEVLVRSKKMLLLRLPQGLPDGLYSVSAAFGTASSYSIPAYVSHPSADDGMINDDDNPVDWTQLKGVPASIADGVDGDAWIESSGNALRPTGRVGVGTMAPAAQLHVSGNEGVLFEGTPSMDGPPASGTGSRMMWAPGRSAFRAGYAVGTVWDGQNLGAGSAAFGYGTTASIDYAFAAGNNSVASGLGATAVGLSTVASGQGSTAAGGGGDATGNFATALGYETAASGYAATALGDHATATGDVSTAMGSYTTAQAFGSLVLGRYNVVAGDAGSWTSTDPVLVVGNGDVVTPSNAFTLLKNGNLTIAGTLTQNSDERLKADVTPLPGVLKRIAGIRGVSYRLKDGERGPGGQQIGLLAQEVREVFPELVHEDTQGTLSVAYGNFAAVLLEAVKEQQAAIEARDRRIVGLEKRLARLEALAGASDLGEGRR